MIVLCFSACFVRQQRLRRVKLKRRGVGIPRFYCGIRFACFCDLQPIVMQRNWYGGSNRNGYFPESEGSDKLNTTPL
jgi:hypothetical protein